jgi:putative ABC transport system permease protein
MREEKWRRYVRFWRSNIDADVDDELRFHFETRLEALIAEGLTHEEARRVAEQEFGDVRSAREILRAIDHRIRSRRTHRHRFDQWRQDFAYALRSLRRVPGLTATIVVTLALGIGVNATLFSLLDRLFLQAPSGISHPEQLRRLYWRTGNGKRQSAAFAPFSIPAADAIGEGVRGLATITVYQRDEQRLGNESKPNTVVTMAGAGYFSVLGVHPGFGRFFSSDEERLAAPSPVAVVSDAFWRRRFSGSPAEAIGQRIVLNKRQLTIIGVAPREFRGADLDATDVWVPLGMLSQLSPEGQQGSGPPWYRLQWLFGFQIIARPLPGNAGRLEAAATVAAHRAFAEAREGNQLRILTGPIVQARGPGESDQEASIAIRLGGVALIVLLIACANVANLLLARSIRRRREIAVRSALGISRLGILELFLAESVLLATGAGAVALLVAAWAGTLLRRLLFPSVHWASGVVDWRVAAFTAIVTLLTGAGAGLAAALRASRTDVAQALKSGGREGNTRGTRLRGGLVATQAALSTVLLVGAALFIKSLHAVRGLDLGYDVQRLVSVAVRYDDGDSRAHQPALQSGIPRLAQRLARVPGVERVALANMSPMYGFSFNTVFYSTGDSLPKWSDGVPNVTAVSPDYFATVGLRLVRGRALTATDVENGGVAIVNRTLARSSWPHAEPIGQCLRIGNPSAPCVTVIGVVEDARRSQVLEDPVRQVYVPPSRTGDSSPDDFVIVRVDPAQAVRLEIVAREEVARMFPGAEGAVIRMADVLAPQYQPWELGATLFTVFGLLALIVAAVGIFSTLSHEVNQRRHELGVRAALGASATDIVRLVVRQGLRVTMTGALVGVVLALAGGRLVASLLYGVAPHDPAVIALVSVMLVVVAGAASALPAWRASRTDPMEALRAE